MNKEIDLHLPCPQCEKQMTPVTLECSSCEIQVSGKFKSNPLMQLSDEEMHFLHIFIHCEGKISDMEKALGVSYPTVKSKISKLKSRLTGEKNVEVEIEVKEEQGTLEILKKMEAGEIDYQTALKEIKKHKK